VNHAPRAVTPLDPEPIQVGDCIGQRAERRGLVQGAVRPVGVVEVLVLAQHGYQVVLVPDQRPVQQLASAAADPPLDDRIHPRRLNGGADNPDASGLEDFIECGGELASRSCSTNFTPRPRILQVHQEVPGLLDDPRPERVLRGAEDPDPARAMLDDGKDIDLGAGEQAGLKKSSARIAWAWERRNSAQPGPSRRGAGSILALLRICQTVDAATDMPSLASSPWIRR
jgi:hypothetical protein